jgi:hypothetical protein
VSVRTEIYGSLEIPLRMREQIRMRLARTCFEITSGESADSLVTSMSICGTTSSSSSSSESDSSWSFLSFSSPGMFSGRSKRKRVSRVSSRTTDSIWGSMEPNMSKHWRRYAGLLIVHDGTASTMSSSTQGQTSAPSSDFKSILDGALRKYEEKTGKSLLDDPLAAKLKQCESVDAIKGILRGQAEAFQQFRDGDQRLMKWIGPTVDVLCTFSDTLGGVAGIVRH